MWMQKIERVFTSIVVPAAKWANYWGGALLFGMMVLTGADVLLRYFFSRPIPGTFEVTELLMAVIIGLGLGYCALEKGHVRVDLFTTRLPRRGQLIADFIAYLVFMVIYVMITWQTINKAITQYNTHTISSVLYISEYPFTIVMVLGCIILCLVLLRDVIASLLEVIKK
jgi:TRAP-type transport system small permease protein